MWWTFEPTAKPIAKQLDELTADAARFLLDEIGHAKAYSLDTMDDVQVRADKIAKLAGKKPTGKAIAAKTVKKKK